MQFNSVAYIFGFLPFVVAGWALLRRTRYANPFIACVSLYFYGSSRVWYLAPLFFTALLDYYIGQKVYESKDPLRRRNLTAFSVVANLGLLSYFKYGHWLTAKFAPALAGVGLALPVISVGLPPAISFYTFQSMSYTIDIYRREFKPYRSVIDYLSFVTFFPHLVAGPIMRARDLLPQLARGRSLPSAEQVSMALFMILFGLFQKIVVADNMAAVVDEISADLSKPGIPVAPGLGLIFAYAFAIQIYCDFAAYSTIARWSAKLLNVELMRNFATPYFSTGPSEFWQRWHISLSTWLRDYLYIPLGGNRGSTARSYRNLMLTMVIGGLWHGAGILFIVWGFWHGCLLVAYRLVPIDRALARFGALEKVIAAALFFQLVCVGWIFFRAAPAQIPAIFHSIAAVPPVLLAPAENKQFLGYVWLMSLMWAPMLVFDYFGWRRGGEFPDVFPSFNTALKVLVSLLLIYAIVFFGRRQASEFIYFAF
ncbi:MAG: rane-bound O-acyltransferase family protein [Hyphomicrobiales bacterium]|nr:rane-bound O-acyltransferase family protein [Hyphomicrobiales bacterium]